MNGSNSSLISQSFVNNTNEMQTSAVFVPIFQAIASSLVMIASLFGNTLVICVVLQSCRMRTVTNYLIVNMACADMLYTIVAMPPLFVSIFNGYAWALATRGRGIYFCKVVNFAQYMLVPVSVLTLAAIAFDRFFAILMPLKRIINKRVFYWILLVIWITSLAVATPTLYSLRVIESNGGLSCDENWAPAFDNETAPMIYMLVLFSVMLCLPLCIITVLYTIICRHPFFNQAAWGNRKRRIKEFDQAPEFAEESGENAYNSGRYIHCIVAAITNRQFHLLLRQKRHTHP